MSPAAARQPERTARARTGPRISFWRGAARTGEEALGGQLGRRFGSSAGSRFSAEAIAPVLRCCASVPRPWPVFVSPVNPLIVISPAGVPVVLCLAGASALSLDRSPVRLPDMRVSAPSPAPLRAECCSLTLGSRSPHFASQIGGFCAVFVSPVVRVTVISPVGRGGFFFCR